MSRFLDEGGCTKGECAARIVTQINPDARTGKVEQKVPLPDETA